MIPAPDIPGHTIIDVLGTGGFATVYRGWQIAVGREVAVKVDSRVLLGERDRRRFFREVTAAGRLSGHPNVIDVYDAGTLGDGRPYLVMELCPAGSLNDELHRHGPMSAAQVRGIGIGIADALAAAHSAGVLHRDIKPANILLNRFGIVGLADFGLASIVAASGEQSVTRDALTPAYAPPESFRLEDPTVAGDVYSLAATLYALLAGRPPRFPAGAGSPSPAALPYLHDQPVEDVPGAPPGLLAVLRQCLAADPAARLPSAAALRDALAALPEEPVGPPGAPGPASAPTRSRRRHVTPLAAGGAGSRAGRRRPRPGHRRRRRGGRPVPAHAERRVGYSATVRRARRDEHPARRVRRPHGDQRVPGFVGASRRGTLPEGPGMLAGDGGRQRQRQRPEPVLLAAAQLGDVRDRHSARGRGNVRPGHRVREPGDTRRVLSARAAPLARRPSAHDPPEGLGDPGDAARRGRVRQRGPRLPLHRRHGQRPPPPRPRVRPLAPPPSSAASPAQASHPGKPHRWNIDAVVAASMFHRCCWKFWPERAGC